MKTLTRSQHYWYRSLEILMISLGLAFSRRKCRQFLYKAMENPVEAIIVPGVPYIGIKWSQIMRARVCWAKYLYDREICRKIIFSGAAVHSPYVEAKIMAMYALALGIPEKDVLLEDKAEHSTENIMYSYQIAVNTGCKRIALATDSFQARLLRSFVAEKVSSDVALIPVVYDIVDDFIAQIPEPSIDDREALVENFKSLKERESFHERLKGTRGLKIDQTVYEETSKVPSE